MADLMLWALLVWAVVAPCVLVALAIEDVRAGRRDG
jgi:hypothetical protein